MLANPKERDRKLLGVRWGLGSPKEAQYVRERPSMRPKSLQKMYVLNKLKLS